VGAAYTTCKKHANILSCDTVACARARRSRPRISAHAGLVNLQCVPVFAAGGFRWRFSPLEVFAAGTTKTRNKLIHSLPAPCGLVWRSLYGVSASCVPVTSLQSYSQPRHGNVLGKTARMASTSAKVPPGPLSPAYMVNRQTNNSTIFSCFHKGIRVSNSYAPIIIYARQTAVCRMVNTAYTLITWTNISKLYIV